MKGGTRQRGEKWSYYFKYQDELGKWKTKEKGGFKSNKEANSALRKAIIEFEELGSIAQNQNYTLSEYIEYWYKNVAELELRYKTLKLYRCFIDNHLSPSLGHLQIKNATSVILQNFFSEKQKVLSKSSVNTMKNVLNGAFELAIKQKIILSNPLKNVHLKTTHRGDNVGFLTTDQLRLIENELIGKKYHLPFLIALHTGMRRGEILGLTWESVDLNTGKISIDKQLQKQDGEFKLVPLKTHSSVRAIKMTEYLKQELLINQAKQAKFKTILDKAYYDGPDFICCYDDGRPLIPDTLSATMFHTSKKTGIDFSFHDLRHTHATLLAEADVNVKLIQSRLGHGDITITLRTYSHVTKKLEEDSVIKFEEHLLDK